LNGDFIDPINMLATKPLRAGNNDNLSSPNLTRAANQQSDVLVQLASMTDEQLFKLTWPLSDETWREIDIIRGTTPDPKSPHWRAFFASHPSELANYSLKPKEHEPPLLLQ
jgi:hypothetical protein